MITRLKHWRACRRAHKDVRSFCRHLPAQLPCPFVDHWHTWIFYFARRFAGVRILQGLTRLPQTRYGSWLMVLPSPAVVINAYQLRQWSQASGARRHVVPFELQVVRTVLHEIGHMRVSPYLLKRAGRRRFALPCKPSDEEAAWVYAIAALGILLGDYALHMREQDIDDTTAVAV